MGKWDRERSHHPQLQTENRSGTAVIGTNRDELGAINVGRFRFDNIFR